jgi:hypothetical protein
LPFRNSAAHLRPSFFDSFSKRWTGWNGPNIIYMDAPRLMFLTLNSACGGQFRKSWFQRWAVYSTGKVKGRSCSSTRPLLLPAVAQDFPPRLLCCVLLQTQGCVCRSVRQCLLGMKQDLEFWWHWGCALPDLWWHKWKKGNSCLFRLADWDFHYLPPVSSLAISTNLIVSPQVIKMFNTSMLKNSFV